MGKQQEKNEKALKCENLGLRAKHDALYKEGRRKRAQLREEKKKSDKKYEEEINALKRAMNGLQKKLKKKDAEIDFYRKARDHNDQSVNMVPFHVLPKESAMPLLDR